MSLNLKPKFLRISILAHPNIPKPLHGVNPRTIMGQKWWDFTRRTSYAKNNFCCWACGTHKTQSSYRQWLEGHEFYKVDYESGRMEFIEVVALCHMCHSFIHSGRLLALLRKGEVSSYKAEDVIERGMDLLEAIGLPPTTGALLVKAHLEGKDERSALHEAIIRGVDLSANRETKVQWEDWRLVFNGEEHPPVFATRAEWLAEYGQ